MPKNTSNQDLKTPAIVLRRTNYGEADRILNLITPAGKISAIVKSVRKARSKLAGGVEMFTLSELQIHWGRSEMGVVTSAKMIKYFGGILKDYERMELMGAILKQVAKVAEYTDSPEWFEIVKQVMTELDKGIDTRLARCWFELNLGRVSGEEVNLYRDVDGAELKAGVDYDWDTHERSFVKKDNGEYGTNEIKLLRLMTKMDLDVIRKIKIEPDVIGKVYGIIKIWEN